MEAVLGPMFIGEPLGKGLKKWGVEAEGRPQGSRALLDAMSFLFLWQAVHFAHLQVKSQGHQRMQEMLENLGTGPTSFYAFTPPCQFYSRNYFTREKNTCQGYFQRSWNGTSEGHILLSPLCIHWDVQGYLLCYWYEWGDCRQRSRKGDETRCLDDSVYWNRATVVVGCRMRIRQLCCQFGDQEIKDTLVSRSALLPLSQKSLIPSGCSGGLWRSLWVLSATWCAGDPNMSICCCGRKEGEQQKLHSDCAGWWQDSIEGTKKIWGTPRE